MTVRLPMAMLLMLLLAAPALAQYPPKPQWIADAKTGCRVWDWIPDPDTSITWSGACGNGLAQGKGIVQWSEGGKPFRRYEGEYRDGKENGRGLYTYANGSRIEAEFRDGRINGRGTAAWGTGSGYEGEWRDGKLHGRGTYTDANGDRYEGEWRDGKPQGTGTLRKSDGQVFSGTWTAGCFRQGDKRAWLMSSKAGCGF